MAGRHAASAPPGRAEPGCPRLGWAGLVRRCDQWYDAAVKQIPAAKFKAQCLAILDSVDDEGIVITKRGKPVAKLLPIRAQSAELIGSLKDKIRIKGDIRSTRVRWDAEDAES